MDFNQVRYFLALADTLNFTRAAEQCYVSQPALTQAIKRLETELGGDLVHRDGRHTALTKLGRLMRGYFEQIDHTRHLVRTTAKAVTTGEIAELNIGIMCTMGPRLLTRMLDEFQVQHPMISLIMHDVTPSSIPDLLVSGAIDGALCARRGPFHPRLRYIDLFTETMVVAFPRDHAFAEMDSIPLSALANERYIDRLHCEFRDEFLELCDKQEIALNVAFRSQREDWIQSLVRDGVGVSLIPRYSLLHPELDHRPVTDQPLVRNVELAVVEQAELTPAVAMLIEQAKHHDWAAE